MVPTEKPRTLPSGLASVCGFCHFPGKGHEFITVCHWVSQGKTHLHWLPTPCGITVHANGAQPKGWRKKEAFSYQPKASLWEHCRLCGSLTVKAFLRGKCQACRRPASVYPGDIMYQVTQWRPFAVCHQGAPCRRWLHPSILVVSPPGTLRAPTGQGYCGGSWPSLHLVRNT